MEEEFSLDVDENTINELKKAIGYDEIEARHKRFMEGKETADDLINHIYHYKIKNDKGLDLDVVELKYYNKIIDLYNKEKEKNKNKDKILQNIREEFLKYNWKDANSIQTYNQVKSLYEAIYLKPYED